jgi:hypothetical protein
MGFYWETIFYNDIENKNKFIILDQVSYIIEPEDISRGYIRKENLLETYPHLISNTDIGEDSYLIEYISTMHTFIDKFESIRIKVV